MVNQFIPVGQQLAFWWFTVKAVLGVMAVLIATWWVSEIGIDWFFAERAK